jgi:predicted cupin superfamily sugar epimerase
MTLSLLDPTVAAAQVIAALGLRPHPEGGHYREIWRDTPADGGRGAATSILFLLDVGDVSHWHRVDADEIWLWQAGAPLVLSVSPDGRDAASVWLGPDLSGRQSLQHTVPRGHWQSATSLGAWTLVSCVVAPAFAFSGFELAPPDWRPTPG